MPPRTTRSKAKAPIAKNEDAALATVSSVGQKAQLKPASINAPKLFVLPKDTAPQAKIVTLAHPRFGTPTRYFVCPEKGFYEFKRISQPKNTPRSWLLIPSEGASVQRPQAEAEKGNEYSTSEGFVTSDASLYIATPIDPLFLILPALANKCADEKQLFVEAEDHFDHLIASSPQLRQLLQNASIRKMMEIRIAAVCDTVDAGDEEMYRLNQDTLLKVLTQKCRAMVDRGLPTSLEGMKIRKALEKPHASIKRGDDAGNHELAEEDESASPKTESESQSSVPVSALAIPVSEAPTTVTVPEKEPIDAPEDILDVLRMHTAFLFVVTSYLPIDIEKMLNTNIASAPADSTPIFPDMKKMTEHLEHLRKLREAAMVARSLDHFSNKREHDEECESRAEKKRKTEEVEKAKKKDMTRGVRDLAKVNTTGMKKMSDFFKKKT